MTSAPPDHPDAGLDLSVVAPAHNEAENAQKLIDEVEAAVAPLGLSWEFIVVDDGSTDATRSIVLAAAGERPWLRCIAMAQTPPGRGHGQSAAFHAGFRAARGRLIAVLDADLQNDPADLPGMLELMDAEGADVVQGDRSAARARGDTFVRRAGSIVGRAFRRWLIGDTIRDTGCSLRVMTREVALSLPLEFKGLHRFIPVTARHLGYRVMETPVRHRPRHGGETKYGAGISKRAIPGLIDCFAVVWMRARRRPTACTEPRPRRAGSGPAAGARESEQTSGAGA